ncbi:MAG: alkaline phosphatase [Paludibacteraceae bacterium]|nr:alkaline phosphatase [Paludibacteraceae bacterium]
MKRKCLFAVILCISVSTLTFAQKRPRNIIFMIGDGMGLAQVTAALNAGNNHLNFERLPVTGLSKTYSASHIVTDSGAGGTALSSGCKTNNAIVGMNADSLPVESLLAEAKRKRMSTGVVVTSCLTHATPASFLAHNINRRNYEQIAKDMVHSSADVMIGGGRVHFDRRSDSINYVDTLKAMGYRIATTIDECKSVQSDRLVGFIQDTTWTTNREDQSEPWAQAPERGDIHRQSVNVALELLRKNKHGFALMIEGSQIDWACHANDYEYLLAEMADFDRVIGLVLDFAQKDGNTLVVITADHETGGLTLAKDKNDPSVFNPNFSTTGHTGSMVPVYAFGPGAEVFGGIQENTEIKHKIDKLMGW